MFGGNRWNRFIYALWAPWYDLLVKTRALRRARVEAMELLALQGDERVCLVGVGTGADFALLPEGVTAVGIDLSAAMLAKARRKLPLPGREISLEQGDAGDLQHPDGCFDAVILTLILSVVPDGAAALREAVRVTRPGGRLLVFDKFVAGDGGVSPGRRLLGVIIRPFGTDITRAFEPMSSGLPVRVVTDRPVLFGGAYRAIVLEKTEG